MKSHFPSQHLFLRFCFSQFHRTGHVTMEVLARYGFFFGCVIAATYAYGDSGTGTAQAVKAVYFQTNNQYHNTIVALAVAPNGTLGSRSSLASTGGKGGAGITAATNSVDLGPDQLFSQGSVTVGDQVRQNIEYYMFSGLLCMVYQIKVLLSCSISLLVVVCRKCRW